MFTRAPSRRASLTSWSASASLSFTPPIMTYSKVTRFRNARAALITASRSYFFSTGMMAAAGRGRRVERDGQPELFRPPGELRHAGQDADGRDGDVPRADAEARPGVEDRERGVHRRPVEQRLPHPHEHDVGRLLGRIAQNDLAHLSRDLERLRFRRNPIRPVAQNAQPRAHPACDEMQRVRREPDGMSTHSIASPSARRHRNLRVPSDEAARRRPSDG